MKSVCVNHPDTKATALCAFCSKPVCPRCIVERNAHFYCSEECAGNAGKATLEQAKADAQNYGIEFSEDYTVLKHFPSNCKLTSYQIPACVTAIGDGAFSGCEELSSITLPAGVTTIGDGAFRNCKKLSRVMLPDSVTAIGNEAFRKCTGLRHITLGKNVTTIGNKAFDDCKNLSSITLGKNVTAIGDGAFVQTGRIVLDKENQNFMIKDDALIEKQTQRLIHYFGQAENYHVPQGVTVIGDYAFSDCENLSSITFPDSVTAIGNDAFFFCVNLKRITLPAAIWAIHPDAFYCAGCEDYVKQNYGHLMRE